MLNSASFMRGGPGCAKRAFYPVPRSAPICRASLADLGSAVLAKAGNSLMRLATSSRIDSLHHFLHRLGFVIVDDVGDRQFDRLV